MHSPSISRIRTRYKDSPKARGEHNSRSDIRALCEKIPAQAHTHMKFVLLVKKSDYATLGVNPRENIQTTQTFCNKAHRICFTKGARDETYQNKTLIFHRNH